MVVVGHIDEVLELGAALVAVDMPIGLPDAGARACDRAARALLGPRRSSVFPAPVRAALDAHPHGWEATLAASRATDGRGLSRQAFNLLPRIAEVDRLLDGRPDAPLHEAHPELAFARLAGEPMAHPKRTAAGHAERHAALVAGGLAHPDPALLPRPIGAAVDDVHDALALVATARHLAAGTALVVGAGERDRCGRPMVIAR